MIPERKYAVAIRRKVMDCIEREGCANSDSLDHIIFAEMLYFDAVERAARQLASAESLPGVAECAASLIARLKSWAVAARGLPEEVADAGIALEQALWREGQT